MQIHKIDATSIGQEARLFTRSDTFWSHSFVNAKKLSSPFYLRALGWPVLAERILTSSSLVFGRFQLGLIFQGEIFQVSSWNMEKSEKLSRLVTEIDLLWEYKPHLYMNTSRLIFTKETAGEDISGKPTAQPSQHIWPDSDK